MLCLAGVLAAEVLAVQEVLWRWMRCRYSLIYVSLRAHDTIVDTFGGGDGNRSLVGASPCAVRGDLSSGYLDRCLAVSDVEMGTAIPTWPATLVAG